jgi:phosphoglycolate phosphatase
LLESLKAQGKTVVLATSKPEKFAVEILRHFGLYDYFDIIAGASMDESRNKKADVIAYAISQMNAPDLSRLIMIGDREQDILGAKQMGIDSIGVLYGYGDRPEHEKAGATYIAEKVENILPLL